MRLPRWLNAALLVLGLLPATRLARADHFTLQEAVRRARQRSPAAVDARGSLASATALGAGARVSVFGNPTLEVTGETGRATKDVNVISSLYLPVDIGGQRGARISEWQNLVEWQGSLEARVHAEVTAATASAYGGVLVARARLEQASRAAADARSEAEAYIARLAVGDATAFDMSVVDSEAARYRQLEVAASASLAQAFAALAELVGSEPVAELPADVGPPRLPEGLRVEDWVDRGPASAALGKESRYWDAVRERAETERTAPLVFIATGGRGDYGEARLGGGLGWSFPVFRRNQGDIAHAEAERTRTRQVGVALRGALIERARGALAAYRGITLGIEELDRTGIPAAERAERAVSEAQRVGKVEMIRVLIARRDLAAARARRLDLVEVAWSAYAELAAIRGELP
ncbi:MAG TPA: TolC family protein [Polyangiaceae bacterium]|jgi:cobalt-zinc-cadmium efflux system outer membrane protein|nr:TolC family protein [Polyangiaceae bacterium]